MPPELALIIILFWLVAIYTDFDNWLLALVAIVCGREWFFDHSEHGDALADVADEE